LNMDASTSTKTVAMMAALEENARAIVGTQHLRAAVEGDAVAGVQPSIIVEPATEQELASVLRLANDAGLGVIPRGGGTKLGWGNPPARAYLVLSTSRLDKIIEHAWADLTFSVEASCTIEKLQAMLAQHGQRLALDALWSARATVGGVLSANDSGALRLRFGPLRELIIGVTLALPDGTLASSGGKVVKNVAGYDLQKLATGALGTLGVITRAVFRVHPLPRLSKSFSVSARSFEESQHVMNAVQDSKLAHAALQVRAAEDTPPVVEVLFEGTEAGLAAQEAQLKKLLAPQAARDSPPAVWNARQDLWNDSQSAVIAKFSVLPAEIAQTLENIQRLGTRHSASWQAVIEAFGIGWLRLNGSPENLISVLRELRAQLESKSGSLILLHRAPALPSFDAWGSAGDALPLMRAVKHQLDPKSTLNPGRFVGGI
jgi:glycolate dehydrogenase FAD-binding subunit